MNRRGAVLLAVLWAMTLAATAAACAVLAARTAVLAAGNRVVLSRGRWAAEACAAVQLARWQSTNNARDSLDLGSGVTCTVSVTDPDRLVNVNTASLELLARLGRVAGLPPAQADGFARRVVDRRRAGPILDVRGFTALPGYDARLGELLTVEGHGRININAAGYSVLRSLPGFGSEAAARTMSRRAQGRPIVSLQDLARDLTDPARADLRSESSTLAELVSFEAREVLISAEGWVASYGSLPRAHVQMLASVQRERLAVVERRTW